MNCNHCNLPCSEHTLCTTVLVPPPPPIWDVPSLRPAELDLKDSRVAPCLHTLLALFIANAISLFVSQATDGSKLSRLYNSINKHRPLNHPHQFNRDIEKTRTMMDTLSTCREAMDQCMQGESYARMAEYELDRRQRNHRRRSSMSHPLSWPVLLAECCVGKVLPIDIHALARVVQ